MSNYKDPFADDQKDTDYARLIASPLFAHTTREASLSLSDQDRIDPLLTVIEHDISVSSSHQLGIQ
jgi:hypothetical protein